MKTKDDGLKLSRHDLADDVRGIIEDGLRGAFASVEQIALVTYWRVGRRVVEEIKKGADRAEYGKKIVSDLAMKLRFQFGGHYSKRNLDYYCQFYRLFPDFEIVNARVHNLRWTHQDVGQMDMYVRMYDDLKRTEGDNPTVGLLLCADTSKDIARYSVLNGSKQLFAAKYMTCLPSENELRKEIERQKEIFAVQHGNGNQKGERT